MSAYPIAPNPMDQMGPMTGDELHRAKNTPVSVPDWVKFPPYQYRPYPAALYHQTVNAAGETTVKSRLVGSDEEKQEWVARGWCDSPAAVQDAENAYQERVARQAAERAFDDRRLGDGARAELDAIDDASEDHVVVVPEAPKKRGRPPLNRDAA